MSIPKAVSPSTLTPGLYLTVNLVAGAASASTGALRILLLSPKSTAGDLTEDTEVRTGGGADSAETAFGVGTPGHLAAKQLYAMFPNAVIDFGAPTAGGGSATDDFTISGAPTSNITVGVEVCGREFDVAWLVGEAPDDIRDKVIAGINARDNDLPATASANGVGVVAVTGKVTGNVSNDIKVRIWLKQAQTGTEAISPNVLTNLTGGAAEPDFTNILDAASGKEYHLILPCISNADAESVAASSNAERALVHIELFNTGLDAKLQTLCYGSYGTQSAAEAAAQGRNVGYAQHVYLLNARSLPCEIAAAEAGDRVRAVGLDPAANRIGNRIGSSLFGSPNINADNPTTPEKESAIGSGVTILGYDAADNVITIRPITTFSQSPTGSPDRRLLDMQNTDATYVVARDIRDNLPVEFANAKIVPDQPPGDQELPAGVTEERDIRAFITARLRAWVSAGVVLGSKLEEVLANGELIVQVDPADPTQVNIVIPLSIVPPLAKFGVVVNRNPI